MRRVISSVLALATCAGVRASEDPLADALSLPSSPPQGSADWHVFAEGAGGRSTLADGRRADKVFSLDMQGDTRIGPGLRAVLAGRLDLQWQHALDNRLGIGTLKDLYLSWQPDGDRILDLGLVNLHDGAATGYNPTDFFKAGTLRSVVSIDPSSIKTNRQGSVMLRGQALWDESSLTLSYSPRLTDRTSDATFDPDWGATNSRHRALLIFSQKLGNAWNPQWLLYKNGRDPPQFGMNLSKLVNDSTVAYVEWSGGKSAQLLDQSLGLEGRQRFRSRVSTGLTYTTSNKLSVTLEYEFSGAGLDRAQWSALPAMSPATYAGYRQFASNAQDMLTQHAVFGYAKWQDVGLAHFDLSGMMRYNVDDHSRLSWLEARYHWPHYELAWQWQKSEGSAWSEYGFQPIRQSWRLLGRYYF